MKEISKAIIAVMTEIEWVAKSMTVGTGNSSYKWVSDKDVRILMRETMIKNGLSLLPISITPTIKVDRWDEIDQYSKIEWATKSKQSVFTEVVTKYLLIHTSGESIELAGYGQGVDTQDKWAGKATTYALKNTLLNMFLVPTWVDTDDTHSDDLPTPPRRVETPTGSKALRYFSVKDLERCIIEDNAFSKEAIKQWALDNWLTIWKPLQEVIVHYLEQGEIIQPKFD